MDKIPQEKKYCVGSYEVALLLGYSPSNKKLFEFFKELRSSHPRKNQVTAPLKLSDTIEVTAYWDKNTLRFSVADIPKLRAVLTDKIDPDFLPPIYTALANTWRDTGSQEKPDKWDDFCAELDKAIRPPLRRSSRDAHSLRSIHHHINVNFTGTDGSPHAIHLWSNPHDLLLVESSTLPEMQALYALYEAQPDKKLSDLINPTTARPSLGSGTKGRRGAARA